MSTSKLINFVYSLTLEQRNSLLHFLQNMYPHYNIKNDLKDISKINPNMVFLKGGTFKTDTEEILNIDDFYISKYPVTFKEFDEFCVDIGREKNYDEGWGRGNRPVINVNFFEAIEYCNWKSIKDGFEPCYKIKNHGNGFAKSEEDNFICRYETNPSVSYFAENAIVMKKALGYRLCSTTEWLFAAIKGGDIKHTHKKFKFGNAELKFGNSTFEVGQYVNEVGIYDLIGNVWEWCWDTNGIHCIPPLFLGWEMVSQEICGFSFMDRRFDSDEVLIENALILGRYPNIGFRLLFGDNSDKFDKRFLGKAISF